MQKRIIFLMNRWDSSAGGIQTVNRELATAIVKLRGHVACTVIVPYADELETVDALSRGVDLISGDRADEWSSVLLSAKVREIDPASVIAVVGHSYFSGSQAVDLRKNLFPVALSVQFVHTSPLHVESLKEYRQSSYVQEREKKLARELAIAECADLVICIGPRLHRSMHDLMAARKYPPDDVRAINCGISRSTEPIRALPMRPTLLCMGRTESIPVKGLDIFAYAAGYLTDTWAQHPATRERPAPQFVIRGVQGSPEDFERHLAMLAREVGTSPTIIARPYTANREDLAADFRGATVFVMPSREEGFGLVACEALSQGVPTLVSENSGIAEVIREAAIENHIDPHCVISMSGDAKTIARRFANAALDILVHENRAVSYCNLLSERLLPFCSWDAGAQQFLDALELVTQKRAAKSAGIVQLPSRTAEVQRDTLNVLNSNREKWNALPGLLTMSIQEAIVLTFEKGEIPEGLPSEVKGVPVIAREGDPIQTTSGASDYAGDLLVDGKDTASIALLFEGTDDDLLALTVAHALDGSRSQALRVRISGDTYAARVVQIEPEKDWALLSIPRGPILPSHGDIGEPTLGQKAYISAPHRRIDGLVNAFELSMTVQTGAPSVRTTFHGLFELVTQHSLPTGSSGSLVLSEDNRPLGMVVAASTGSSGRETYVYAVPLAPIMTELNRRVGGIRAVRPISATAVMPTDEASLQGLLKGLDAVERVTLNGRIYFKGRLPESSTPITVSAVPHLGNIGAAISATTLILDNDVRRLFVVGLCGGLISRKQQLADVVISSDVIYYEPGVLHDTSEQVRFRISGATPSSILRAARGLAKEHDTDASGTMRIHIGSIASGEKVIRSQDRFSRMISGTEVLAVEMEGAGVFEAAVSTGKDIGVALIRGIADFADDAKHEDARSRAAANAVQVALELIRRLD